MRRWQGAQKCQVMMTGLYWGSVEDGKMGRRGRKGEGEGVVPRSAEPLWLSKPGTGTVWEKGGQEKDEGNEGHRQC